ncbi:NAD(P)-binding protein [Cadophora sp. DSE1049]|nr:NAD(P)-binding protein [Cadophora sp. DSE1049]
MASVNRLEGKTIVITGASSGIGRSTAVEFARQSPKELRLILTARRINRLHELAAEIAQQFGPGVKVLPIQLDSSKPHEVREFVANLPKEWQNIDILVNNAGLAKGVAKSPDIVEDDIKAMLDTNVTGLISMTQAVLKVFLRRGRTGAGDIVNIGSIAGRDPYQGGSVYCASKAAVRAYTDALRRELVSTRIRVIVIDPGQVKTEFSTVRFNGDKSKAALVYKGCEPLTAQDIAEVLVFTVTRRENVVVADTLIMPNHQAAATVLHKET